MSHLEEALALALKLDPKERLQLIEQLASSVERDIEKAPLVSQKSEKHWGENLIRVLNETGSVELDYPELEDPVDWVKRIRKID